MSATCPDGGGGGSGSHSGSGSQDYAYYNNGNDDGDGGFTLNNFERYGNIDGYGYATERCVCYTDGTGCDCEDQDESLAVGNMATYGPAVVCVDASAWQDYEGGILTASSGCSSAFLDVNHCVQAVGYAFTNGEDDEDEEGGGQQGSGSGSGSNSHSGSGSRDNQNREGYWIVRNQWSEYWGMNGYAYVAMGGEHVWHSQQHDASILKVGKTPLHVIIMLTAMSEVASLCLRSSPHHANTETSATSTIASRLAKQHQFF